MDYNDIVNNESAVPELVPFQSKFYEDRHSECLNMLESLKDKNFESIRKTAHNWKGFCTPYGFQFLAKIGKELEVTAQEKSLEECQNKIQSAMGYLKVKKDYIS